MPVAPTGKAALRLTNDKDFSNIKASTIDKFIVDVNNKKISAAELREYKNVIIDEYIYDYDPGMQIEETIKIKKIDIDFWDFMQDDLNK
jgi:hypothetical protein